MGRRVRTVGVWLLVATFFLILANIWTGIDHFGETALLTLATGVITVIVGGIMVDAG